MEAVKCDLVHQWTHMMEVVQHTFGNFDLGDIGGNQLKDTSVNAAKRGVC